MANVKFDNFRWSSDQDPHWDEWHLTVELPEIDPATGENRIVPNVPRFEMQPPFDEQTYLAYEELRYTDPDAYTRLPFGIDSMTFKLFFDYLDASGEPQSWEMPKLIDMTEYTQGYWFLARYTKASVLHPELDPHALHVDYFDYLIGSNLDPILEQQFAEGEQEEEEFLPVIILMQDKQWYDWPHGTDNPWTGEPGDWSNWPKSDLHRTTDRMLKKLAMKGAEIKEKFLEQEADDSNTDNNTEKWDFMLHFAAPLYTGNSSTAIYLYNFFERMMAFTEYTFEDYQAYLGSTNPNWPYYWYIPKEGSFTGDKKYYKAAQPVTNLHITEGNLTGYDVRYGWSYIFQKTFQGQFHDDRDAGYLNQGHEEPLLPNQASIQMYERQERNEFLYRKGLDQMHVDTPDFLIGRGDEGYHDYVIITYQHGDYDENGEPINMYYDRILVMALSQEYKININDYREAPNYQFRYADIDLFDVDESYKPLQAFRIPLSIQGLKDMPVLKREEVIADSACWTVFLVHKEKVKWYESGFFKIFIVVVAIIVIVVVAYYGLGSIATSIATAFGVQASPIAVFLISTVLAFAIGQIIAMAGQAIGGLWGTVFMIVASIYLAQSGGLTVKSGLPGSWGNVVNYLNSARPYLEGAYQLYAYYVNTNLQHEWELFMLNAREKQRLLDEAYARLEEHGWLSPWDIVAMQKWHLESPDQFMARSKMTNPGAVANDMVYNFARMALNLPRYPMEPNSIQDMFEGFQQQIGRITGVA